MNTTPPGDLSTSAFEPHRRFLRGLAYRMLGSVAEAEDAVQDAWLRWRDADHASVQEPRAFLAQTVTRLCLDRLKSAQRQREHYVGVWLPEPWLDEALDAEPPAQDLVEMAQDLEIAFLLVLQRLTPAERAVFLLSEVFDWEHDAIAQAIGRSAAACRQLARRARQQLAAPQDGPSSPDPHATADIKPGTQPAILDGEAGLQPAIAQSRPSRPSTASRRLLRTAPRNPEREQAVAMAFAQALQQGDIQALADTLAEDVVFMSDGGGKVTAVPQPQAGRQKVAKMLLGFAKLWAGVDASIQPVRINTLPGAILRGPDGQVVQTMAVEVGEQGQVRRIYVMRNPDKLGHVPAQARAARLTRQTPR